MVYVSVACGSDSYVALLPLVSYQGTEAHYKYWLVDAQYVDQFGGQMP